MIDGRGVNPVVTISSSKAHVTLSKLTISNGRWIGGGIYNDGGTLTICCATTLDDATNSAAKKPATKRIGLGFFTRSSKSSHQESDRSLLERGPGREPLNAKRRGSDGVKLAGNAPDSRASNRRSQGCKYLHPDDSPTSIRGLCFRHVVPRRTSDWPPSRTTVIVENLGGVHCERILPCPSSFAMSKFPDELLDIESLHPSGNRRRGHLGASPSMDHDQPPRSLPHTSLQRS